MALIPGGASRLLQSIAVACLLALGMVVICFSTAGMVMLQLLAAGLDKYVALGVALLVAVGCSAFITFNHKIRNFIVNTGANIEDE
jgi:hypothetical protein